MMHRRHTSNHRAVEAYVDGELPVAFNLLLSAHLLVCRGCRQHAATIRAIKQALAARADDEPTPL